MKEEVEMKYNSSLLKKHPKYGFLQFKPTPTPEEINEFYTNDFYSGEYKNFNESSLEVQINDIDFYKEKWSDILQNISNILGKNFEQIDLLDVGCGWSQALLHFRDSGVNCCGFDPAPEAVSYGIKKGLDVKLAGMESMNVFKGKKFNVVTIFNVLEHLPDPIGALEEIRDNILKPGGLIIIDVPNEFNAFQMAGQKLHNVDPWWVSPPAHLNYFSKDTLENLLKGVGYKVNLAEASFPLEIFLLFGDCYVGNKKVGKECHEKRIAFERNLRNLGYGDKLHQFYQSLAEINLGRNITIYATLK
jgi:2-polyprenyl-3-methyl-5-hydroxy-6-metoxy-1,4-benzoquinol methylase